MPQLAVMKKCIALLIASLLLTACATFRQSEPLPSAGMVDLEQFIGQWYVIASMPSAFDGEARNAVHIVERQQRGFSITYRFDGSSGSGEPTEFTSSATVLNPGINTEWKVRVAWPFNTTYRIIDIADDYSWALVGHPDRTNAWVLSRTPQMDAPIYSDIVLNLQDLGYNIGRLRHVVHD
jgi:apolipoprotein D and lipocalin family protein